MALVAVTTTQKFVCIYLGTELLSVLAFDVGANIDIDDSMSYIEHATIPAIGTWMTANSITTGSVYATFHVPLEIADDDSVNGPNPDRVNLDAEIDLDETGGEE